MAFREWEEKDPAVPLLRAYVEKKGFKGNARLYSYQLLRPTVRFIRLS